MSQSYVQSFAKQLFRHHVRVDVSVEKLRLRSRVRPRNCLPNLPSVNRAERNVRSSRADGKVVDV